MVFKGLIAATVAVALSASPAFAAANQPAAVAPASESVDAESTMFGSGGFIIPLLALAAVILGILAATDDNGDDLPVSP